VIPFKLRIAVRIRLEWLQEKARGSNVLEERIDHGIMSDWKRVAMMRGKSGLVLSVDTLEAQREAGTVH
jgi:hypothetical protein